MARQALPWCPNVCGRKNGPFAMRGTNPRLLQSLSRSGKAPPDQNTSSDGKWRTSWPPCWTKRAAKRASASSSKGWRRIIDDIRVEEGALKATLDPDENRPIMRGTVVFNLWDNCSAAFEGRGCPQAPNKGKHLFHASISLDGACSMVFSG